MQTNGHAPHTSLSGWRAEKEYRAVLCVQNARLWTNGYGTVFSMDGFYDVGYTPPGVADLAQRPLGEPKKHYKRGTGRIIPSRITPVFHSLGVRVAVEVGFRIDEWWAKAGSYPVWSGGVPYMSMALNFELHTQGAHRVEYNGTPIPSQLYQTGRVVDRYNLVTQIGGAKTVEDAMRAGCEGWPRLRFSSTVRWL
jgi:hypothetical protein